MAVPLEIKFRDVSPLEDAAKAEIEKRAEKLSLIYSPIMNCRVVVDASHKHKKHGLHYKASITINLPRKKIAVTNEKHKRRSHEDINVVIRDAFDAAGRKLEDYAQEQRGKVKRHEAPPHGRVLRIFPEEDYGIIETSTGDEVYFHRNSVLESGFDKLKPGSEVRFSLELGEKGPQASTVHSIGKHHVVG
jgi:cold shock CspA family protein